MKKLQLQKAKLLDDADDSSEAAQHTNLLPQLDANIAWVKQYFDRCSDLLIRRFLIGEQHACHAVLLYLDGMTDSAVVHDNILQPFMHPVWIDAAEGIKVAQTQEKQSCRHTAMDQQKQFHASDDQQCDVFSFAVSQLLPCGEVTYANTLEDGVLAMMNGDVFLLLDGYVTGLIIDAKGFPHRDMGEPRNEKVLRGPQEAFVEAMRVNTAMLRRRLHTSQLKLEQMSVGTLTQTQITIAYLEQIVNVNMIAEIRRR